MGKGQKVLRHLAEEADRAAGAFPGFPILEISGDRRVLVENHCGVLEYGKNCVAVKMSYGQVRIQGECLQILCLTRQQLVVCGKISQVTLGRREGP